ncbi:MAG: hypothetical protein KatS3mg035_1316 [Bacteroidia bacterium]|nr:MAG: hypothetical protein KatS3mg035_1316 [Bacteroidia bacterium]
MEPYIDEATMKIHYEKHHQGYVNNLNKALQEQDAANLSLEEILKNVSKYSDAVRNNGGGHYNHTLFWEILTPQKNTQPSHHLKNAIEKQFGSLDSLKNLMTQKGLSQFGSGWVWLIVNNEKKLEVTSTPNQDNPLMDVVKVNGIPILGIDVWEHAYYLKYQNKRNEYLQNIWNVINWEEVSKKYEKIVPKGVFDDWIAIKEFHKVMSSTFHPSEEGDLEPIKKRSQELLNKAQNLKIAPIPDELKSKVNMTTIDKLIKDCEKVHKLVKSKAKDTEITKALNQAHDTFHEIIGQCKH